jgi:hypothetical protein
MFSVADAVKSRHASQAAQAKSMQAPAPQLPGDYGCAGFCEHPVPPPPAAALNQPKEAFTNIPQHMVTYWFVLSVAASAFLVLTLRS